MNASDTKITVFYDGACPRCVKDRCNYEKMAADKPGEVLWFDITDRDAEVEQLGIDPQKALAELHIMTADGQVLSELDAYIVLMRRVIWLKPLAWLIGLPVIRPLLARGYHYSVNRRLKQSGRWPK
ncbi:thiol-disulfide oxidoreductase DCC family protein [Motiliproteus sp.]|uniref:thiol-disulfide oxidoreductase DCC family protein n=1 Tax=Motiliproteus sp. TaxID=1898955 RepID=UPI003BAA034B